jgi:hypothetical protein
MQNTGATHEDSRFPMTRLQTIDAEVNRSSGGGGSHQRTRLCCVFSLFFGKIQGNYIEFSLGTTIDVRLRGGNSIAYQPNSLPIGSGKLFA